jgi:riboflavin synthase
MFTGIVEAVGSIESVHSGAGGGRRIWIRSSFEPSSIGIGDSIATSGVCLTVVERSGSSFAVDAGPETLERTTIGELVSGDRVNLERSCTLSTRLGGHLVQGHVDGVGVVRSVVPRANAHDVTFEAPGEIIALAVPRGSIAVDGISLTITGREVGSFTVMIIPHTFEVTTMGTARPGTRVNLEADMIARYVAGLLEAHRSEPRRPGMKELLDEHGFT